MRQTISWRSWTFVALWATSIALLLWAGGRVDGYMLYVQDIPLPHPYPWAGVGITGAILSVETLVFYALIRPESYRRSWGRALGTAMLSALLVVVFGLGMMHAPPYAYAHWLWLAGCMLVFSLLAAASAIGRARSRPAV